MKILFVTTVISTVNAFLIPHIELLINEGHKVDVAANTANNISSDLIKLGCDIHHIDFSRSIFSKNNFKAYKDIKKLILEKGYDLIHVHTPIASALTRFACRKNKNMKVFYTAHGFHFYKGAPLQNWIIYYPIEKFLSRYTDCIITINEEDYNIAKSKNFKAENIKLVPGVGIDLKKFEIQTSKKKAQVRKEYGYKDQDFILFYAAELNSNKHQDLLIKAVNILKGRIPCIKLLLAGSGPLENHYKRQVELLGLSKNIEFLGYRKDVANLLMISDVAVASSRREGLPVNVMEAMATGLPLVVTDIRGHRDLVKNGENGYVIKLDDIESFTNVLEKLYKSTELREKIGKKNIELIQSFSIENVLKELEDIYKKNLL